MIFRKLFWNFYFWFLLITLVTLAGVSFCSYGVFKYFYLNSVEQNLRSQATLSKTFLSEAIVNSDFESVNKFCKRLEKNANCRITIILQDGKVVGDSYEDFSVMENHSDRPEFLEALEKGQGVSTRYSTTLNHKFMYLAIALTKNNENVAVIRTSMEVDQIDKALGAVFNELGRFGLLAAIIVAVISLIVSRHISKPIEQMKDGAQRFASGNLTADLELPKTEELRSLSIALNKMASELNSRIEMITCQKQELGAVLSSMTEGVVALDSDGKIINMNKAAFELLDIDETKVEKRDVEEIVRDSNVLQFIKDAGLSDDKLSAKIISGEKREKCFHIYGRKLNYKNESKPGVLVVFNDITKLRQLENVRRDFVANVSHELKTPITSIKGFVETLLEGAVESKEDTKRFLKIIGRHTDRLSAIIEDLLILCRIQEEGEAGKIRLEKINIKKCVSAAVEICSLKAKSKDITFDVKVEDVECEVDSFLIEQAMVNLIDNAIKYSGTEEKIVVEAKQIGENVRISVKDNGFGISQEHLERIFERFYVTDKARSRTLGGTGLGLSIVKHICQSHGGNVEVESRVGQGSEFIMTIPKRDSKSADDGQN